MMIGVICFSCGVNAKAPAEDRYGPIFYGVELPETGARVLLVIDTSKSMGRKDGARKDGGRRWDTLRDEVRSMTETMQALSATRSVPYSVSLLYEGGSEPHTGTEPQDFTRPGAQAALLQALESRALTSGGSFEHTFGEVLWPLVSRQHITHIFYLGDDDIAAHADPVRKAVAAWYTLPRKVPAAGERKLWSLKHAWWEPWSRWRTPRPGVPVFKSQRALPPPPKDVVFSCIAIGQPSVFLKELATLGKGSYVERVNPRKKRK